MNFLDFFGIFGRRMPAQGEAIRMSCRSASKDTPTPDAPPPVDDIEFNALVLFGRELGATCIDRTPEKAPF
ncbi:hypothetical protein MOQ72_36035 [Saccharopolyspora sp. K220]|uniref:hypothetical protein n=1 Tax=Saccharopolyspora soli TaxID=2926618 RepID=UPI001F56DDFC|nr:hypothetical protein [Saccharopolyspora soli]MCI2422850.1 hypothetical protein [Saccharopolyspora soli]